LICLTTGQVGKFQVMNVSVKKVSYHDDRSTTTIGDGQTHITGNNILKDL